MNPQQRVASAVSRIASVSSVVRQRQAEADRALRRGDGDLAERLEEIADRFEALAKEMEAAIN